jgi:hypothetical protein
MWIGWAGWASCAKERGGLCTPACVARKWTGVGMTPGADTSASMRPVVAGGVERSAAEPKTHTETCPLIQTAAL